MHLTKRCRIVPTIRKDRNDWVKRYVTCEVEGVKRIGRPKIIWTVMVKHFKSLHMCWEDAVICVKWKRFIESKLATTRLASEWLISSLTVVVPYFSHHRMRGCKWVYYISRVVDNAKWIVVMAVCVSICLSLATFPHYCTDPDLTCRIVGVPSSCALLCRFAIGARVLILWQHSAISAWILLQR